MRLRYGQPVPTKAPSAREGQVNSHASEPDEILPSEATTINPYASQQADDITGSLRASCSELSGLFAETQKIHEQSWRVLQSLLEDLQRKACQAVDDVVSRIGQEIHERANYELAMILENFDVKTEARLAA